LRTDGSPTGVGGLPWFSEYGFQQTRGFRALKVWMALKHQGADGYRRSIERDIMLAERLASLIRADAEFDLFEPQSLSIVCFRYVPRDWTREAEALNALNKTLLEQIQLSGQAFLSSTVMDGTFWLRACIVNPRTSPDDLPRLVEAVRAAGSLTVRGGPSC
jgi:glutamate/tyrosine decarboxylase-like PLP-dependent enzyme